MARRIRRRDNYAPRPEWRRNAYGMRYYDTTSPLPDGRPRRRLLMLTDERGAAVTSLSQAEQIITQRSKLMAVVEPVRPRPVGVVRLTIGQVVLKWRDAHPGNATKDAYVRCILKMLGEGADRIVLGVDFPDQLTVSIVDAYRERKKRGHDLPLSYLRSVLGWAMEKQMIPTVDEVAMKAMTRAASAHDPKPVMSQPQFEDIYETFRRQGPHHEALVHCLSTYGWRAKTACRLTVGDVDLINEQIRLMVKRVKGQKEPHFHTLLPETLKLLRPILANRAPTEPLFLHDKGDGAGPQGWSTGESAYQLANWYGSNCRRYAKASGGTNALKRWALESMALGRWPWPAPVLDPRHVMDFTGHRTVSMVMRYRRNSPAAQRHALGLPQPKAQERPAACAFLREMVVVTDADVAEHANPGGAIVREAVALGGSWFNQGNTRCDETVSFSAQYTLQFNPI